ncbi:MAG: excinuclease ABC subunit UvrC [Elusimicrobiales bacterium]
MQTIPYKNLPAAPGVYIMRDAAGKIIYIGKANSLAARVAQYFQASRAAGDWKTPALVPLIRKIDCIVCDSERDALVLERKLIRLHQPFFNSMWKDDKSYPYIKITDEDFPRILAVRRKSGGGKYYGPYPDAAGIKRLLRYFWRSRLLPLRPCKWEFSLSKPLDTRRINGCLYFHTGQCPAPCAGKISRADYLKIVRRAAMILEGRLGTLLKRFSARMKNSAAAMRYEEAGLYRDLARAVEHMGQRARVSRVGPGQLEREMETSAAAAELARHIGLARPPVHIEGFDTSHLFGRQPVGSMVCFIAGKPNRAHYRRFKIKTPAPARGGDDFAMIAEITGRRLARLKAEGGPFPDLLLIDGGMGQLAAACRAASGQGVRIPIISLAKEREEIFVPGRRGPVVLDRASPALRLLMAVRDEAHRFGIKYHRWLRSRKLAEDL